MDKIITSLEDVEVLPSGRLPKVRPDSNCNGRDPQTKELCAHTAGYGTPHEGTGRCRVHGGLEPSLPANYAPVKIRDIVDEIKDDSDVTDLRYEIAMARAAMSILDMDQADQRINLNSLLNTVGKLVEKLHNIEISRRYLVPAEEVQKQMRVITDIILDVVSDPEQRAEIAQRIEDAMTVTIPKPRR